MRKIVSLFTIIAAVFVFQSCGDLFNVDFDAKFNTLMNIDIEEVKDGTFPFSATATIDIEEDDDIKENIDRIKSLNIERVECTFTGIPQNAAINTLTIAVDNTIFTVTLTNITENYTLDLPVNDMLLDALSNYLEDNKQATVSATGTSSYAPMVLGVKLTYYAAVTAGV